MANFQKSVLIFATVLLVICLLIVLYILIKNKYSSADQWPPLVGNCPDYWVDLAGDGSQCSNTLHLGKCNTSLHGKTNTLMDFTKAPYIGQGGACAKYKWANGCGLVWDGITSGNASPCEK
jgi:hypothetical protein